MYSLAKITSVVKGQLIGDSTSIIHQLLIDSRTNTNPSNGLFIAIKGERHDGHNYIDLLYKQGVTSFLVSSLPKNHTVEYTNASFIVVTDTLVALQELAAYHRQQFSIPVIGITGSNGKTIVKEWLYQLLKDDFTICRSPKSYNSQVGVPLSVWQLKPEHTLGIFEAGISKPQEMERLEKIIQPTIGILTNIGSAHDEGFSDRQEKVFEKAKLLGRCEQVVIQKEYEKKLDYSDSKKVVSVSLNDSSATLYIQHILKKETTTTLEAVYENTPISITIPFTDEASIENACTCWATLLVLKYNNVLIAHRMQQLIPVAMRLEMKQGINGCVLINDFYNSDIHSLSIALDYLNRQHRGGKKILILSDIEQSGQSNEALYASISKLIHQYAIDVLIGIGPNICSQKHQFTITSQFYTSTTEAITHFYSTLTPYFQQATILLKGARSFEFEQISQLVQQKSHDTILEINLNALVHNINYYRSLLSPSTKLMCMVKATGYGSGSAEIATTLQHHRVDYLAVAYADEGVELRKAGITLPIMVMNPEENAIDDLINYSLEPEVFSFKTWHLISEAVNKRGITHFPIHLKIDTGMHRLGFEEQDITPLKEAMVKTPELIIKSVFSHLVASDDSALDEFTNVQIKHFEKWSTEILSVIQYPVIRHICNSGAIGRFPTAHFDMVRLGIGMYGVSALPLEQKQLQHVPSLKTRISQIKHVKIGETVGYSRKGKINTPTRIATVPIGYADGFSRQLGNGHFSMLVNKTLCSTVGNICMDMCMIDVTAASCKEGDEVIIFETSDQLNAMAHAMNTISYEVLTAISTRVKRIYVQE